MDTTARSLLALTLLLGTTSARAEGFAASRYSERAMLTVGWEVAAPVMDLRSQFIDVPTPTGLSAGFRFPLASQLAAGADLTWNRFKQDSTLGDQLRMDVVSVQAKLDYYFTGSEVQPYAGLGVGGIYREAVLNIGPTQTGFGLCGGPELGLLLTLDAGLAVNVAVRYEITTASFDVNGDPSWHVKYPSWVGAHVGLGFY